ncbi:hypothetical protein DES41_11387 [Pseudorhodoferax soli]|uniref:Uncharacterized protein n=1 Tax=Pseudorhodoferax soli TaxID=545864 RepID=A0A368XB15_9BURK|nr:hypothetical protein DES41_11387 [Pseudorhodoferax soli]
MVIERTTRDARFEFNQTRAQKWVFWMTTVCVVSGCLFAVLAVLEWGVLAHVATRLFYAASLLVVLYQITVLAHELVKMRNPEKEVSLPLADELDASLRLIRELAAVGVEQELVYARAMFERSACQLRERIALIVGALDKVGLIPLGVSAFLSFLKFSEGGSGFGAYEWIGMAFVGLYLFAVRMLGAAQWMEAVGEIFGHAIALKKSEV